MFPFSAKLAKENGWSRAFTQRVIDEYKRFCFLAIAADHPVSPSESVDQAWHMHILYTEEYWKYFCGEVLQKPFHHGPSRGGVKEHRKFDDWYSKTLESYQAFFGEEAPRDIWPLPADRAKHHFERVNRLTHWVIPKPRLQSVPVAALGSLLLVLLLIGCTGQSTGINPFNWYGSDFLEFYMFLFAASISSAIWLRWQLRAPVDGPVSPQLGSYELAYLNGGKVLALNAAIAGLVARKLIDVDHKTRKVKSVQDDLPNGHPLERFVMSWAAKPEGRDLKDLRGVMEAKLEGMEQGLTDKGLWVSRDAANKAKMVGFLVALIPVLLGGIKIMIGIQRDRPTGILTVLVIVTGMIALFFLSPMGRSRYGDGVLRELKQKYLPLSHQGQAIDGLLSDDLLLAIALFGLPALQGSGLDVLRQDLQPPSGSSGCGGGSSGCGGGSDGGGGGCGGGGCGGCGG